MMSGPPQGSYIIDLRAYLVKEIPEKKHYQAGSGEAKTRPFSALISNLGNDSQLVLKSFGNWPRFPVIFPFHPSPDCALNRKTRLLSVPDRKFSLEKGRGVLHRASRDARAVFTLLYRGLVRCRRPV